MGQSQVNSCTVTGTASHTKNFRGLGMLICTQRPGIIACNIACCKGSKSHALIKYSLSKYSSMHRHAAVVLLTCCHTCAQSLCSIPDTSTLFTR